MPALVCRRLTSSASQVRLGDEKYVNGERYVLRL